VILHLNLVAGLPLLITYAELDLLQMREAGELFARLGTRSNHTERLVEGNQPAN